MTKKRVHKSTASNPQRQAMSIERLARQLGHEVTTDSWRNTGPQTSKISEPLLKFLGRPVLGSTEIVEQLRERFPTAQMVTSLGELTFNLMHRRYFQNNPNGHSLLTTMRSQVTGYDGSPIECETKPYQVKEQHKSKNWGVRIPLNDYDGILDQELQGVYSFCRNRGLAPHPQPISIRIAETTGQREAFEIADEAWKLLGDTVILGSPIILPID